MSGKTMQTSTLEQVGLRMMKPEWDLREIQGIVASEKDSFAKMNAYFAKGMSKTEAEKAEFATMVKIPGMKFKMMTTEVTQKLYQWVMGENPSNFKGQNTPVECVSWYDAIYFCNKLSVKMNLKPVYSVDGITDVSKWNYKPHNGDLIREDITQNLKADGFRLPTLGEWETAAKGGKLDEVGWYYSNSEDRTHPVAQKKPNSYGLYDMQGNVWEWVWDSDYRNNNYRYYCGGSWYDYAYRCEVSSKNSRNAKDLKNYIGFRIGRNTQ
ncbi:MAG: SUMF1/EgtB/PvdO family nonheme iron enzyme [Treponema sp.]|nr:SUMF1/EgtB/PvdO family nonheme iron enzyme [Treponema sp.]